MKVVKDNLKLEKFVPKL